MNSEKSSANSKIIEKVTDDKGRTFTKQVDIMNAQRDFFSNLYKKKIDKEGMEEKNYYFYGKHNNTNNLCSTER